MKQSTCGAVICQPGGDELKHDIGAPNVGPLHLTELYKYQL